MPGPLHGVKVVEMTSVVLGPWACQMLGDMGADAFGLLDHLKVESANLVGVSMGGMIAQTMALDEPGRVASLCSISES